jgi:hypothetical protein
MRKPIEKELREPWTDKCPKAGGAGRAAGLNLMTARERMWQAMLKLNRKQGSWTMSQIEDLAAPCDITSVRDYIDCLVAGKLAERLVDKQTPGKGEGFSSVPHRLLVTWAWAPRLTKEGKVVTQGFGQLAMWRVARIRKTFVPSQLSDEASTPALSVKLSTAKQYCLALEKAGYLKLLSKGKGGIESHYQLIRDTGPQAPAITRAKVIFDRNTGAMQPLQTAQELCDELG